MLRKYSLFLGRHDLIWNAEFRKNSAKYFFNMAPLMYILSDGKRALQTYIKIFTHGKAEVFLNSWTYEFMTDDVSYHLLCETIVERIRASFDHFQNGNEAKALEVFIVKPSPEGASDE
jgi:hypothetical protein